MPRKLRNPKMRAARVPQSIVLFLLVGDCEADDVLGDLPSLDVELDEAENAWLAFTVCRDDSPELSKWWAVLRAPLMAAWIAAFPGSRPFGWFLYDAPRWRRADLPERVQGIGDGPLAHFAEPRRRVGGVGDPVFEHVNYTPEFAFGLPMRFVDPRDVELYSGRARDVNGKPIMPEYHEGHFRGRAIDRRDPPRYESQSAYLARHGLFVKGERARLTDSDFEPEVLTIDDDDANDKPAA